MSQNRRLGPGITAALCSLPLGPERRSGASRVRSHAPEESATGGKGSALFHMLLDCTRHPVRLQQPLSHGRGEDQPLGHAPLAKAQAAVRILGER